MPYIDPDEEEEEEEEKEEDTGMSTTMMMMMMMIMMQGLSKNKDAGSVIIVDAKRDQEKESNDRKNVDLEGAVGTLPGYDPSDASSVNRASSPENPGPAVMYFLQNPDTITKTFENIPRSKIIPSIEQRLPSPVGRIPMDFPRGSFNSIDLHNLSHMNYNVNIPGIDSIGSSNSGKRARDIFGGLF